MLPAGLLFGIFETLVSEPIQVFETTYKIAWIKWLGLLFYYVFCIFSPMIFVCVHEDMRTRKVLGYEWIRLLVIRIMESEIFRATEADEEEEILGAIVEQEAKGQYENVKEKVEGDEVEMGEIRDFPKESVPKKEIENEPQPSSSFGIPKFVETFAMSRSSSDIGTFV